MGVWRRVGRIGGFVLGGAVCGVVGFVGVMWMREWRPQQVERLVGGAVGRAVTVEEGGSLLHRGDTIRLVSWNIGYAGLGDDMDFFYDGGTRMRTSRERTERNLRRIVDFLSGEAASAGGGKRKPAADFILLQEVDVDSRRSYRLNEFDSIRRALAAAGYDGWRGLNYRCDFVPIPLREPMGRVESGVATFSRWRPVQVVRYAYPGGFSFPVRLFNLKRCLLSTWIPVRDLETGHIDTLFINNTHNTAYDTGGMRNGEFAFLRSLLAGRRYTVTMGDWNSSPAGYCPAREAVEDPYFSPWPIDRADFPSEMTFVYDPETPSVRYGYEPYRAGKTTTTLVDFALCGPGVEPIGVETLDFGFKNSDHNPVVATFVIR